MRFQITPVCSQRTIQHAISSSCHMAEQGLRGKSSALFFSNGKPQSWPRTILSNSLASATELPASALIRGLCTPWNSLGSKRSVRTAAIKAAIIIRSCSFSDASIPEV